VTVSRHVALFGPFVWPILPAAAAAAAAALIQSSHFVRLFVFTEELHNVAVKSTSVYS
jgi:hypothetical protein